LIYLQIDFQTTVNSKNIDVRSINSDYVVNIYWYMHFLIKKGSPTC